MHYMGQNPFYPLFFFSIIPIAALIANYMAKGEGHLSPWCIFYSVLIYLSVIPGVFAFLLIFNNVLFERKSVYDMNVMLEILPIMSMVLSLYLIKRNVAFNKIPGFGHITSFLSMMMILMLAFYLLDKMHIILFSSFSIFWLFVLLIIIFLIIWFGAKKIFA